MPLARVKELLAADPDRFAAAIAEIDRTLEQRAEQLQRTPQISRGCSAARAPPTPP